MSLRCDSTIALTSMPGSLNFSTSLPRSAIDGSPDFVALFDSLFAAGAADAAAAAFIGAAAFLAAVVFAEVVLRVTMVVSSVGGRRDSGGMQPRVTYALAWRHGSHAQPS